MKSHKLKEKDSFLIFDDSQDEEETKTKVAVSIEVQTDVSICSIKFQGLLRGLSLFWSWNIVCITFQFSCNDASTNTNLSLKPGGSSDAERLFYMEAAAYAEARIQEIRKWNEEVFLLFMFNFAIAYLQGLARIASNKRETQKLQEEYEELFISLSSKLEDSPAPEGIAS